MFRVGIMLLLLWIGSANCLAIHQDTIPQNLSNKRVITGQFSEQALDDIFEIVRIITRLEIDAMNAYSLRDVLVHEMNAFVVYEPNRGFSLNFQGTGQRNIKLLLNGIPLLPHSMDYLDVGQFPLNNIERIEILEGPSSVMYGSHAVSTVINLITFAFQKELVQYGIRGSYTGLGDYNVDGRVALRLGRHDLQMYGGRYFFGGISGLDSGRVMQWKPRSQQFVNLQYRYRFYRGLEAFAFLNGFREDTRDKGYPINQSIRANDHQYITLRGGTGLGIAGKLSKYHTLDAIFSYHRYHWTDHQKLIDLSNLESWPLTSNTDADSFAYQYLFSRIVLSRKSAEKALNYQFGMEYNFQKDQVHPSNLGIRREITQWAGFGAMSWQPTRAFGLKGGISSMYSDRFRAPISPELKLRYDLNRDFTVLFSMANAYRVPTFNELFATGPVQNFTIKGNLNLKAEISSNYYASILFNSSNLRFYTTFFISNRENGIELVPISDGLYTYRNSGKLRYLGNRIALESTNGRTWLKLGLANTGINSLPGQVGNYYFYLEFLMQMNIRIAKNWQISTFNKFQGRREDLRLNSNLITEYAVLTGFALSDVSLRWNNSSGNLRMFMGVKNLFNQTTIRESIYFIDENDREQLNRVIPQSIDFGRRIFITVNYLWN